jgi:hypothetical protein
LAIIPVIAVFAIAATLCTLWARLSLQHQRDQRLAEERVQAAWLAEAGVRRGAANWSRDPAFVGETWEIAGVEIDRPSGAAVVIQVFPDGADPRAARIEVRVRYPAKRPRVSLTKTLLFTTAP